MQPFSLIPSVVAVVKKNSGIFTEVALYSRGRKVYFRVPSGFIEVKGRRPDGSYATSHTAYFLQEYSDTVDGDTNQFYHITELGQARLRYGQPVEELA